MSSLRYSIDEVMTSQKFYDVIAFLVKLCEFQQVHATEFASRYTLPVGFGFNRKRCKLREFIRFLYSGHVTHQIWS